MDQTKKQPVEFNVIFDEKNKIVIIAENEADYLNKTATLQRNNLVEAKVIVGIFTPISISLAE